MKKWSDWLLLSSTYTAICAVGLCMATERLINNRLPALFHPLHLFIFGSTLVVYNIHFVLRKPRPGASRFNRELLPRIGFTVAGAGMMFYGLWFFSPSLIAFCAVLGVISIAYSVPVFPLKSPKSIRQMGWVKLLDITIAWTVATSVVPMLFWAKPLQNYPWEILLRFAFMFTLCLLFDIRDMEVDMLRSIRTIPAMIGKANSYRLMYASTFLFILVSYLQFERFHSAPRLVVAVITSAIIGWVTRYLKINTTEKAYIFWGDGVMIVYAMLVLALT